MNRHNLFIFNFKKNTKFILKLLLLLLFVVGYCTHVMPQYEGNFTASLSEKVKRLETTEGSRIVLLGNSNVIFGFNSESIEKALGMPVINMGLHGSLGNAFHEEMAKIDVHEGDVYILCHTTYSDRNKISDPVLAWTVLENHWKLWSLLRKEDMFPMLQAYPAYLRKCLDLYVEGAGNDDSGNVYSRSAVNEYGDIQYERKESMYIFNAKDLNEEFLINDITIDRINELNKWLKEKGATLLVAGYPIYPLGKNGNERSLEEIMAFQMELSNKLECPVISNYLDYVFDYEYFYDTVYHLTSEGAEIRTQVFISEFLNWRNWSDNYDNMPDYNSYSVVNSR